MDVTIFAPSPSLTVTIEEHGAGPDIHVHAGGQGVWQARMLRRLGAEVTLCCTLTGETGQVAQHLLEGEGFRVVPIARAGRGAAYVHDRREGERTAVAESEGEPLGRHELDELYGVTLREGIASGLAILSGPDGESTLPADTYRRLAADLRTNDVRVVVDLAGDRMLAALEGGIDLLKVSDEELHADGLLDDVDAGDDAVIEAMDELRRRGAKDVIVTRSSSPFLVLDGRTVLEVTPPELQTADTRGAGDSLTAGVSASLAAGAPLREAVAMGAAAGALNVTRHGLGTGDTETIERLRQAVRIRTVRGAPQEHDDSQGRVSPEGLAALAETAADAGRDEEGQA
ncbi:PfkB family carbohydrate kinase [Microbacterium marinilacus]|uniref:PfkB family carbohydrate kinase n=1 Tax=Microbacterium marinilacus TaxID=415209 RepID=A0ABP7BPB7_9MICO|nr:PfkB family carbohydrate kinase [Microbacterium marinilacus]MBY0689888.1 bifunctional hydroxymethylpyrimidine kinase/phosphomethylpyrimidine kinase [Microbacterium marinilacus]